MLQASLLDGGVSAQIIQVSVPTPSRIAARLVKRALDIGIALTALAFLAPLMAFLAMLVALDGGPVLFSHRRIGRGAQPFGCLKFRTMIDDAEASFAEYLAYHPAAGPEWAAGRKLRFDPRITAIGRLLRSTSLDELPQLVNILRGEMSLVGPRAVTDPEVGLYGAAAPLYLSIRPGLTGLWQVSGRNQLDFPARVRLDERYVREWGLLGDFGILARTPMAVLRRTGAL